MNSTHEEASPTADDSRAAHWDSEALEEVIEHLDSVLYPEVSAISTRIEHALVEPVGQARELGALARRLADALDAHIHGRCRLLFPKIRACEAARQGRGPWPELQSGWVEAAIADELATHLQLRKLVETFAAVVPPGHAISELTADLDRQVRALLDLEERVLFPRALDVAPHWA